jgi:hypothetical protein
MTIKNIFNAYYKCIKLIKTRLIPHNASLSLGALACPCFGFERPPDIFDST